MSELIFVTTENCELCNRAEKKIGFLKNLDRVHDNALEMRRAHKEEEDNKKS